VKQGTEIGKTAKEYMDSGKLVPDDLIIQLVKERLDSSDVKEKGWLLDGFPRTKEQAEALAAAGVHPEIFILIGIDDDKLVERVEGRRLDPETGKIYHLTYSPPPEEITHRLEQRSDDNPEKLKARLIEFHKHIEAVEGYFKDVLFKVDGTQGKENISEAIFGSLDKQ